MDPAVTGEVLDAPAKPVYGARRLLPVELGAAVRTARERLGLNAAQAAVLVGVSATHMRRIERGQVCPSRAVALEIACVLHLDADVADRLIEASAPDSGRSYPGRPDRGAATRRTRYHVAAVLAAAAGVGPDGSHRVRTDLETPGTAGYLPRGQARQADGQALRDG